MFPFKEDCWLVFSLGVDDTTEVRRFRNRPSCGERGAERRRFRSFCGDDRSSELWASIPSLTIKKLYV